MLQVHRFLALFVGIAAFAASGPSLAQGAQGYVQEVSGTVTGQVGTGRAASVSSGQTLPNNATITTGPRSYAVLKFEDGTAVLLKENTSFQVQNYTYNAKAPENSNAIFNLLRGGLRMVTGLVTSRNRDALKVGTPLATIGIRGTEFVAELTNPLYIQVINGVISVTNAAGSVLFSVGQAAVVQSASTLGGLIPMSQVPPGVFTMPNVPLTPVPGTVPSGPAVGGGGVAGGGTAVGAAVAVGAAAAAAVVISSEDQQATTTHH
jgi:hypothetical protein